MTDAKYEQLSTNADDSGEVFVNKLESKWFNMYAQKTVLTLCLIGLYFSLSIGLTFYQRWLLQDFGFPLTVVMYHLVVKWLLALLVRIVIQCATGVSQLLLPFGTCLRTVGPTGVVSGIDVGFSNWGLKLVTISLYTMTKSTTIIFILGFAIMLGLERKTLSLVGIVLLIASGLVMFTYKATQFNLIGFNFLVLASFAAGLRWTFAQLLMQKAKLGLHNPIDMVFHIQPWMFLSLLPFTLLFEGYGCYANLVALSDEEFLPIVLKVSVGAGIAFAMEISEFLVVTYTSSLTLSIAGIFKEICILFLAVHIGGDQLSSINMVGLSMCLLGIITHVVHKLMVIRRESKIEKQLDCDEDVNANNFDIFGNTKLTRSPTQGEHDEPLLSRRLCISEDSDEESNLESKVDADLVLYEVTRRRDN